MLVLGGGGGGGGASFVAGGGGGGTGGCCSVKALSAELLSELLEEDDDDDEHDDVDGRGGGFGTLGTRERTSIAESVAMSNESHLESLGKLSISTNIDSFELDSV